MIVENSLVPLSLTPEIINTLDSYEQFLSLYLQTQETSDIISWYKSDILAQMANRFGEKSLTQLADDTHTPRSTLINYLRVSRAFSPDKRIPNASFTLHFISCFVDKLHEGKFLSNNRFSWVEKAADQGWSSRKLIKEIQESKIKEIGDGFEQLLTDGENKGKAIKILVDKLLARLRQGDEEAHKEIVDIYIKIFGAL